MFTYLEYDSIYLTDHEPKNKDAYYINAVPVDGYKKNNQFIVTQYPLPNTLAEFWQMIFKKHVKVIVSLNDIPVNDMVSILTYIYLYNSHSI